MQSSPSRSRSRAIVAILGLIALAASGTAIAASTSTTIPAEAFYRSPGDSSCWQSWAGALMNACSTRKTLEMPLPIIVNNSLSSAGGTTYIIRIVVSPNTDAPGSVVGCSTASYDSGLYSVWSNGTQWVTGAWGTAAEFTQWVRAGGRIVASCTADPYAWVFGVEYGI